ncbi:MAG: YybS family protein [Selenomonadaceae bacterium]|nr:YybS family protein [Selenomonadaceae bacterium]
MESKVTPTVEGGLLAALTVILSLAAIYLPVLGAFVEFFCAVPIAVLTVRQGFKSGAAAVAVSFVLLLMFTGPIQAVRMTLSFGLCGLVLGQCLNRGFSAVQCFIPVLITGFLAQIVSVAMLAIVAGVDVVEQDMELVRDSLTQSFEVYESMGVEPQVINQAKAMVEPIVQLFAVLTPIILFFVALINTVGTYILSKWIFQKLRMKFAEPLPPFTQWRFPVAFLYLASFSALGLYWGQTRQISVLYFIAFNALVLAAIAGLIQGFSLLSYLADRYKVSKFVRRIIFVILILNMFFLQVVAVTGLFDMVFDYRKHLQNSG